MNSKTSNIYPWVVVGLLWGVALTQLYGQADALYHADSYDDRCP